MADRETARLEGRVKAANRSEPWPSYYEARQMLAAADQWDRDNGYVTIRLDNALLWRLAEALDDQAFAKVDAAGAVMSALREAAKQ